MLFDVLDKTNHFFYTIHAEETQKMSQSDIFKKKQNAQFVSFERHMFISQHIYEYHLHFYPDLGALS